MERLNPSSKTATARASSTTSTGCRTVATWSGTRTGARRRSPRLCMAGEMGGVDIWDANGVLVLDRDYLNDVIQVTRVAPTE